MTPPKGYKHTPEARSKMAAAARGRKHSTETRAKMSVDRTGRTKELANSWKGDDVGVEAVHYRARQELPRVCAHADESCKGLLEAAFNHDAPAEYVKVHPQNGRLYSIRVEDYMRLCCSHHKRYDVRVMVAT